MVNTLDMGVEIVWLRLLALSSMMSFVESLMTLMSSQKKQLSDKLLVNCIMLKVLSTVIQRAHRQQFTIMMMIVLTLEQLLR